MLKGVYIYYFRGTDSFCRPLSPISLDLSPLCPLLSPSVAHNSDLSPLCPFLSPSVAHQLRFVAPLFPFDALCPQGHFRHKSLSPKVIYHKPPNLLLATELLNTAGLRLASSVLSLCVICSFWNSRPYVRYYISGY